MAKNIVDVALRVHTALGPGLFESVYEVEDKVIVEIKSLAEIAAVHKKQLLTCGA